MQSTHVTLFQLDNTMILKSKRAFQSGYRRRCDGCSKAARISTMGGMLSSFLALPNHLPLFSRAAFLPWRVSAVEPQWQHRNSDSCYSHCKLSAKTAHASSLPSQSLHSHSCSHLTTSMLVTWNKLKSQGASPVGRIPAAAVSCLGQLFIFGGETDDMSSSLPNRYLNDLWQFSPELANGGVWKNLFHDGCPNGPPARVLSSMVFSQDRLVIYGGIVRNSAGEYVHVADMWSFDLQEARWQCIMQDSSLEGGPGDLSGHTATVVDQVADKMIVFGGTMNQGETLSDKTWIFSFADQIWREVDTSVRPEQRNFHTAVAIPASSILMMWGGIQDKNVWAFNAEIESWSVSGHGIDFKSGRSGAYYHGMLFSFGGFAPGNGNLGYSNSLQWQTPNGRWQEASVNGPRLPNGRCYAVLASVSEGMYMFGGFRSNQLGQRRRVPVRWQLFPKGIYPPYPERLSDIWQASIQGGSIMASANTSNAGNVVSVGIG
eukprot:gnl/MRDRNA2_/MRDRNA2_165713_c0_seq1.p1 gnl/MRDRNA2_/MRDRNA2_165713_c0~~gnl/MRDRNA2_/MRDRNA2_165713_c0_seq1.p1  ORF type:complete len:488 (-),score=63.09 gnl/MRDRNA2_/MRDRNA2_165713_c0_seq1:73-1536(-)